MGWEVPPGARPPCPWRCSRWEREARSDQGTEMILGWKQQLPWPELARWLWELLGSSRTPCHPESCLARPSGPESGADGIIAALWEKCGVPAGAGSAATHKVTELLIKPGPAGVCGTRERDLGRQQAELCRTGGLG